MWNPKHIIPFTLLFCCCALNAQVRVYTLAVDAPTCTDSTGRIRAIGWNGTPPYTYKWSTGETTDTIEVIAGIYTVTAYSAGMIDSFVNTANMPKWGIDTVKVHHSCVDAAGGIEIELSLMKNPIITQWFSSGNLISTDTGFYIGVGGMAGDYMAAISDGSGCKDTVSATIKASAEPLRMIMEDSTLCCFDQTRIWFYPTYMWLTDGYGNLYNSTADTLGLLTPCTHNYSFPSYMAVDTVGCIHYVSCPVLYHQSVPSSSDWYVKGGTNGVYYVDSCSGCTYQWYYDDSASTAIPGAIYASYSPTQSGDYSCRVTNEYGCGLLKLLNNFVYSGIEEVEINGWQFYPNPATNFLNITFNKNATAIAISDIAGRTLKHFNQPENTLSFTISVGDLQAGLYFIKANDRIKMFLKQ